MDVIEIRNLANELRKMANTPDIINLMIHDYDVIRIKNDIFSLANELEKEQPIITKNLNIANSELFLNVNNAFYINPFACGQILALLDFLHEMYDRKVENIWFCIHPRIIKTSKQLYLDGHHSEAALKAIIEINGRLKEIYKIIKPEDKNIPDGTSLMNTMFSENKPLLQICDMSTETGKNWQSGLRSMLSGAISALRNPPAHSNNETLTAEEAMRRLMFASMLMYKIDEAVKYTGVQE